MFEQLSNIAQEHTAIKKAFVEKAKAMFEPAFKEFFEAFPNVKAFGWTQYTPYFNDGDTCEFNVNDLYYTEDGDEDRSDDLYDWNEVNCWRKEKTYSAHALALDSLRKALHSMEYVLQSAFGDHVKVIVTPSGIDVQEYDHD